MRYLTTIVILLFAIMPGFSRDPGLMAIRNLYLQSAENRNLAGKLFQSVSKFDDTPDPVLLAYKGSARAMMAENVLSPLKKYQFFSEGKEMLDRAIRISPGNPEIRFLRYMVQLKSPSFLGYDNKSEDLQSMIHYFSSFSFQDGDPYYVQILEILNNPAVLPENEFVQINRIYKNYILSQTKSSL